MTIYGLNATLLPTKGLIVSVVKLHEVSLAKSLPVPWANTLVGIVPTNIRTEPGESLGELCLYTQDWVGITCTGNLWVPLAVFVYWVLCICVESCIVLFRPLSL